MLTNTFIQLSTRIFTKAKIHSQWTTLTYEQARIHTDTVTFMLTCKNSQTFQMTKTLKKCSKHLLTKNAHSLAPTNVMKISLTCQHTFRLFIETS